MVPSSALDAAGHVPRRTPGSPNSRQQCHRGTCRDNARGSRRGSCPEARSWQRGALRRSRRARGHARAEALVGPHVVYWMSIALSRASARSDRGARDSRRRAAAWPPSRPSVATEIGSCSRPVSTCSQRSMTSSADLGADSSRPCACTYFVPARAIPTGPRAPCTVAVAQHDRLVSDWSWLTWRMAGTGLPRITRRRARRPRSWPARCAWCRP